MSLRPSQVLDDVAYVARAGGWQEYVLMTDGTLIDISRNRNEPVMSDVLAVYAGGTRHVFVVDTNHVLWGWGENTYAQLGIGTNRGEYEGTPWRDEIPSAWTTPVLVLEYVPTD